MNRLETTDVSIESGLPVATKRLSVKRLSKENDRRILEPWRSQFAITTGGQWQQELPNTLVGEASSERVGI